MQITKFQVLIPTNEQYEDPGKMGQTEGLKVQSTQTFKHATPKPTFNDQMVSKVQNSF